MAQIKKLQNSGEITKTKSWNDVQLSDSDINKVIGDVSSFIAKNSNYSEDIKGISDIASKVKEEMLKGNMPKYDDTGTGFTIGNITVSPGKHNQNVFGNFAGEKLNREFAYRLKEGLDYHTNLAKQKSTSQSTSSQDGKYGMHVNPINIITKKYFGNNYDLFEKGWNKYDPITRKEKLRKALIESINEYGDPNITSRIKELDNPNVDDKTLIEIGNLTGYDYDELLNGTKNTTPTPKTEDDAKREAFASKGTINTSDAANFIKSQGYNLVTDSSGKNKIYDDSGQLVDINPGINQTYGTYYGYGIFKDNLGNYYVGKRGSFSNTPVYQASKQAYSNLSNTNRSTFKPIEIDLDTYRSPFEVYRNNSAFTKNGKVNYYDLTNNFSGISENQRIYAPSNTAVFDELGNLDLTKSKVYIRNINGNDNLFSEIKVNLNPSGESEAIGVDGKRYNLGAIGSGMNTFAPKGEIQYERPILSGDIKGISNSDLNAALNRLNNSYKVNELNDRNLRNLISDIANQNFKGQITPKDFNNLLAIIGHFYKNSKIKPQISQKDEIAIENLKRRIANGENIGSNKNNSNGNYNVRFIEENGYTYAITTDPISGEEKRTFVKKFGGTIKKLQVGGSNVQIAVPEKKLNTNAKFINRSSQDGRVSDIGNNFSDTADAVTLGLDALSLAGGALGVGAGLASTGVQFVSDLSRDGLHGETLKNLGINLGFTALALIPGMGAAKMAKGAVKTAKIAKVATEGIKDASKAIKILETAATASKDLEKAEKARFLLKGLDVAKDVVKDEKVINNIFGKIAKGAANTKFVPTVVKGIGYGSMAMGAQYTIPSIGNAIDDIQDGGLSNVKLSDLRNIVGGAGAVKSVYHIGKNQMIKRGTEPISAETSLPRKVKVKGGLNDVEEVKGKYSNSDEALSKIKESYKTKLNETTKQISDLETKRTTAPSKEIDDQLEALKKEKDRIEAAVSNVVIDSKFKNKYESLKQNQKESFEKTKGKFNPYGKARKLKELDDDASWWQKRAVKTAKSAGYTEAGYGMTQDELLSKLYSGLSGGKRLKNIHSANNDNIKYQNKLIHDIENDTWKYQQSYFVNFKPSKELINQNKKTSRFGKLREKVNERNEQEKSERITKLNKELNKVIKSSKLESKINNYGDNPTPNIHENKYIRYDHLTNVKNSSTNRYDHLTNVKNSSTNRYKPSYNNLLNSNNPKFTTSSKKLSSKNTERSNTRFNMNRTRKQEFGGQLSFFKSGGLITKLAVGNEVTKTSNYQGRNYSPIINKQNIPYGKFDKNDRRRNSDGTAYSKAYLDIVNNEDIYNQFKNDVQNYVKNAKSDYIIKDYKDFKRLATDEKPGPIHDWIWDEYIGKGMQSMKTPDINLSGNKVEVKPVSLALKTSQPINKGNFEGDTQFGAYNKRKFSFDPDYLIQGAKLIEALSANTRIANALSKTAPDLLQTPTEIYRPVLTNLANEEATRSQVKDAILRNSKPITSNENNYRSAQLETLSKTIPLSIQAKAENTDMYNKTLDRSIETQAKYAINRNDIANRNLSSINDFRQRMSEIEAEKIGADHKSLSVFADAMAKKLRLNQMYKSQADQASELEKIQAEYDSKIKPYSERYDNFNEKDSNIYKEWENINKNRNIKIDLDSSEGRTDKLTWRQAIANEKDQILKDRNKYIEQISPVYKERIRQARYRNPYLYEFNIGTYKRGGSLLNLKTLINK